MGYVSRCPAAPDRAAVRQHIGQAALAQRRLERAIVAIGASHHDRLERDAGGEHLLDERQRQLRLGAECRVLLAAGQAAFRPDLTYYR